MKIQTTITETIEQVQVIKEVKKQKAMITFEVDQDFLDVINVLGNISATEVRKLTGKPEMYNAVEKVWCFVRNNPQLGSLINYDSPNGFTLKLKPQEH